MLYICYNKNKQINLNLTIMKRVVLTMKGADGKTYKFILPTKDHFQINNLIEKHQLSDYKLINWKIENIVILS